MCQRASGEGLEYGTILMKLSIIMLVYNGFPLVHARLVELNKYLPYEDAEVLVIDNGSEDEEVERMMNWWVGIFPVQKNLQYIKLDQNYGYGIGNNKGAALASGEYLLFMNPDVVIHKPFLDDIVSMLHMDDKILLGGRIVDWDGGWNSCQIDGRKYVVPYCEGWVLAMSRPAWDELGGFDPIYYPYDCEDLDLSLMALAHGFHLSSVPSGLFTHLGGKTFIANMIDPQERREVTEANQKKLWNKWRNRLPGIIK